MTHAKHTPAPWTTKKENGGTVIMAADKKIAWCPANHFDLDKKTTLPDEANARLIAASPELLEAGIAARKYLCDENRRADDLLPVIEALEVAIAKAKGE